jgi:hypothetical protein
MFKLKVKSSDYSQSHSTRDLRRDVQTATSGSKPAEYVPVTAADDKLSNRQPFLDEIASCLTQTESYTNSKPECREERKFSGSDNTLSLNSHR